MKKILQAFDTASSKSTVAGIDDMRKFVSVVAGVNKSTIAEDADVGSSANDFILAADKIKAEVLGQIDKVKTHADEAMVRDLLDKFDAFMVSYHSVGKSVLQPDLLSDSLDESELRDLEDYRERIKTLQALQLDPETAKDSLLKSKIVRRRAELEKEARAKGFIKNTKMGFKDYAAVAETKRSSGGN